MTTPIQSLPRNLPAPTSVDNVIARHLLVLSSQVGYREGRDADGDWNNDNAYGLYFKQNKVAWCSWFDSWAAVASAIPDAVIPRTGYTPTGYGFYKSHARALSSGAVLKPGDKGYVYSASLGRVHHVFTVEKVLSGNRIQTLEGNTNQTGSAQGNGVYRNTRTLNSSLRFARPDYALAVVKALPPKGSDALPPKDDSMAINPEDLEAVEKKYVKANQKWLAQTAPERAVSEAVAARILDGKPAPTADEISRAMTAVRGVWGPVLAQFADPK